MLVPLVALKQDDSRLLVQMESIKANFSVVDELGSCYLSVRERAWLPRVAAVGRVVTFLFMHF